jgi:hypothetical protein
MKLQDAAIRDAILVYISEQVPEAGTKRIFFLLAATACITSLRPSLRSKRPKKPGAVISSKDISAARLSQ